MVTLKICGLEHQNSPAYAWPSSSTHTQYEQVEMCQIRPLQVENLTTIDHETLAYARRATAARHMRIPTLQKTWDRNKMHYLHVCVFFVTEIPGREERERERSRKVLWGSLVIGHAVCAWNMPPAASDRELGILQSLELWAHPLFYQLAAWLIARSAQGSRAHLANTRVQPPRVHVRK